MSPDWNPALQRHQESITDWDSFNDNFWFPIGIAAAMARSATVKCGAARDVCDSSVIFNGYFTGSSRVRRMLASYCRPALRDLLTPAQERQVDAQRTTIWKNHPSRFLGDPIIEWVGLHPGDPRVPPMLYALVKLPRWSCRSKVGSQYSKAAYQLLHNRYPTSSWTQKADYWY